MKPINYSAADKWAMLDNMRADAYEIYEAARDGDRETLNGWAERLGDFGGWYWPMAMVKMRETLKRKETYSSIAALAYTYYLGAKKTMPQYQDAWNKFDAEFKKHYGLAA